MKATICAIILAAAVAAFAADPVPAKPPEPKQNIAVLTIDTKGGLSKSEAESFTERLSAELLQTGKYTILERSQVDAVLQEVEFQKTAACAEQKCLVKAGKILAVRKMVGGSVSLISGAFNINLKVIDVETSAIDRQVSMNVKCSKAELFSTQARKMARQLAGLEALAKPWYARWYFWAPTGAVVAAGTGAAVFFLGGSGSDGNQGPLETGGTTITWLTE